jgi:Rhodopirellula transposase DDE domain
MDLKITSESKEIWRQTLSQLTGQARRIFMASVVKGLGRGGVAWTKRELGWDPTTLRKGLSELEAGFVAADSLHLRGRKGFSAKLPNLRDDLRSICEANCQTDPTFRTTQLYRRLTAAEALRCLREKGYTAEELPSERSICRMLGELGFKPRRVAKTKPLRKIPETDAIFEKVHEINAQADADPGIVRLSIDTKTTVPIGNLSRGGKSRRPTQALDHDLEPEAKLTPFGIHRPDTSETWLSFTTGHATADFMVDRLTELWPTLKKTVILHIPSSSTPTTAQKTADSAPSGSSA